MTPQQKAINKAKLEISKDIKDITNIAKRVGLGELLLYLHYLHFVRLIPHFGNIPKGDEHLMELVVRQVSDAYKYLIQLIFKHSHKRYVHTADGKVICPKTTVFLTKAVLQLNSKYESVSFLTLFENLEVHGERDQFVKVNLDHVVKDSELSKYFYYGFRTDRENNLLKNDTKRKDDFLNHFSAEHKPYADLFKKEFHISLEKFVQLIDFIIETINSHIKANKSKYVYLENGNVDIQAYGTILTFGKSLFISKKEIFDKFGIASKTIIQKLTFNPEQFEEKQLRYNLIARQPLLEFDEQFLVSPELILDSLFVNTHYSFLETSEVKEEYKKRYASNFLNKISLLASKFGFKEVKRELELYERKNQIGDIDIVLKNSQNQFLLIEAKNHTLPLDVYFHDFEAIKERLEYLQKEWETKVDRRYKHIEKNHLKYNIESTFKYIIITKSPEILSHFSKYLVISLNEFKYWLEQKDLTFSFQELFEQLYDKEEDALTAEQLKKLETDLNTIWKYDKD